VRTPRPDAASENLARLLHELEPELRRTFVRFRIPEQDCEDLLQDCLLAFVRKQQDLHAPGIWLSKALSNRCLNYWRSRRRAFLEAVDATALEEIAGSCDPDDERVGLARDLTCAISGLPRHCRSILRHRYGLDKDSPEVAQSLGYSPTSIRQVTHRCLSALTRRLLDNGFATPSLSGDLPCPSAT
jgi:RNA polymerase sigma factor (sigma-70 family)